METRESKIDPLNKHLSGLLSPLFALTQTNDLSNAINTLAELEYQALKQTGIKFFDELDSLSVKNLKKIALNPNAYTAEKRTAALIVALKKSPTDYDLHVAVAKENQSSLKSRQYHGEIAMGLAVQQKKSIEFIQYYRDFLIEHNPTKSAEVNGMLMTCNLYSSDDDLVEDYEHYSFSILKIMTKLCSSKQESKAFRVGGVFVQLFQGNTLFSDEACKILQEIIRRDENKFALHMKRSVEKKKQEEKISESNKSLVKKKIKQKAKKKKGNNNKNNTIKNQEQSQDDVQTQNTETPSTQPLVTLDSVSVLKQTEKSTEITKVETKSLVSETSKIIYQQRRLPDAVSEILKLLHVVEPYSFLHGGALRDEVPRDYDIATGYPYFELLVKLLPECKPELVIRGKTKIILFNEPVYQKIELHYVAEIDRSLNPELTREQAIAVLAMHSDFTMNSLVQDENTIYDVCDKGKLDIQANRLRAVISPSELFKNDIVCIVRAIQFIDRFSCEVDDDLESALKNSNEFLSSAITCSPEKIGHFNAWLSELFCKSKNIAKKVDIAIFYGIFKGIFSDKIAAEIAKREWLKQVDKIQQQGLTFSLNHLFVIWVLAANPSMTLVEFEKFKQSNVFLRENFKEYKGNLAGLFKWVQGGCESRSTATPTTPLTLFCSPTATTPSLSSSSSSNRSVTSTPFSSSDSPTMFSNTNVRSGMVSPLLLSQSTSNQSIIRPSVSYNTGKK